VQARRAKKTLRQKQARRHTQFESPDKLPARPYIPAGNVNSEQNPRIGINQVLQFRNGLYRRENGQYADT